MDNHPYMPVGQPNLDKQKENEINRSISILEKYHEDERIRTVVIELKSIIGG